MTPPTVIVLGGGVAGMTAAHELAERGFGVRVYELRDIPGGKARSIPVRGSGVGGRADLPGEHGFRFFPGFYQHVPDTMRRIPNRGRPGSVFDHLVPTTRAAFVREGQLPIVIPDLFPRSLRDVLSAVLLAFGDRTGLSFAEVAHFAARIAVLVGSCDERRINEWENVDWWDFVGAGGRSAAFQAFLADGITRRTVAAKADAASTRTIGYIFVALMRSLTVPGGQLDRLLDGPTSSVWISPWLDHLVDRGVDYHLSAAVCAIRCQSGRIAGVEISEGGRKTTETADYYVSALPVEIMRDLVTPEMVAVEPVLGEIHRLQVSWMNGIQFYLARDVPIVHGHVTYTDAPFALTSISQRQFWPDVDFADIGDGMVKGILSVDISDWETPGVVHHRPANELSPSEIKDEVWAQLKTHLNQHGQERLRDTDLLSWFLDPDIVGPNNGRQDINLEPLLVNTAGSWAWRPEAETRITNLFLA
ncbi:MAG TPA: FAD-dependent oxidoreductase, partial [Actinomycetota bacterium]|nr:FAD-dependent oxidoreductase [Actinomycetota bacterium]